VNSNLVNLCSDAIFFFFNFIILERFFLLAVCRVKFFVVRSGITFIELLIAMVFFLNWSKTEVC
jgi:hypothetical protein